MWTLRTACARLPGALAAGGIPAGVGDGSKMLAHGRIAVLLDSHDSSRRAQIAAALAAHPQLVAHVVDHDGELPRIGRADATPDVVVIDRPGSTDLARVVADVRRAHPTAHVVLLHAVADVQEFYDCLMAGAVGFCDPAAGPSAVVRTVHAVLVDGVAIPRSLVRPLVDGLRAGRGHVVDAPAGRVVLTRREWEVLLLLRQRRSTEEMAAALFVSKATVRSHVAHVLQKLGVSDRDAAAALVGERGGSSTPAALPPADRVL